MLVACMSVMDLVPTGKYIIRYQKQISFCKCNENLGFHQKIKHLYGVPSTQLQLLSTRSPSVSSKKKEAQLRRAVCNKSRFLYFYKLMKEIGFPPPLNQEYRLRLWCTGVP